MAASPVTREPPPRGSAARHGRPASGAGEGAAGGPARPAAFGVSSDAEALLAGVLRIGDAVLVAAVGYLAYYLRHASGAIPDYYLVAFLLGMVLTANFMHLAGVYSLHGLRRPVLLLGRSAAAWIAVLVALVVLSYMTKTSQNFSRIWFFLWFVLTLAGFVVLRGLVLAQLERLRRAGRAVKRTAVVGGGDLARAAARQLERAGGSELRLVGFFGDGGPEAAPDDGRLLADLDGLPETVRRQGIETLVVAVPWNQTGRLERVMAAVRSLPIDVYLWPEPLPIDIPVRGFSELAGMPVLDVWQRPLSTWAQVTKAVEDRLLAAGLLLVFGPFMLAIAAFIRLDSPGPALFRQMRAGFNGQRFEMLKFRTMVEGPDGEPTGVLPQARRDDPRTTRVGRWLRRTSLDELPQLINVLRGDMSLVGPRPHALVHDDYYAGLIDEYLGRLRVKPGITGWAQVNGLRGETDTPEKMRMRVQHDLEYIENWSVLFDLKILFLTLFVGFVNENAY